MRRRKRTMEMFSMSFLDVVSCGFGAIILLLVITKQAGPMVVEQIRADLSGVVSELSARLDDSRARARSLDAELAQIRREAAAERALVSRLRGELSQVQGAYEATRQDHETLSVIADKLAEARQSLTEEMRRLRKRSPPRAAQRSLIGGVPVDSEYIIFIIDTSGSMYGGAWPLVLRKLSETLAIYPKVKGIQVMNDMGVYMFSTYAGRWIPDTPARRQAIIKRLATWTPFSNSSPVEGITEAIRRFHAPDRKISLYVFGDEFSSGSLEAVVQAVDRINRADARGNRRVRIHAVGFPTQFSAGAAQGSGVRFAALMRVLAQRNGGTFVGLNSTR